MKSKLKDGMAIQRFRRVKWNYLLFIWTTRVLRIAIIDRVNYGIARLLLFKYNDIHSDDVPLLQRTQASTSQAPSALPPVNAAHSLPLLLLPHRNPNRLLIWQFSSPPLHPTLSVLCSLTRFEGFPIDNERPIDRSIHRYGSFSDMMEICMKSFCSTFRPRKGLSFWLDLEDSDSYWSLGIGFQEVNAGGS